MGSNPEEQISPELVLVDPELRERLLREALLELLYARIDEQAPRRSSAPTVTATAPTPCRLVFPRPTATTQAAPAPRPARTAQHRFRLSSLVTATALAMLFVALPSLAFLPPRQAPTIGARGPATATEISWTVDPSADYYVLELLTHGRLARVAHPAAPPARLDALAPGTYTWQVFSGYGAVADANTRGPIDGGTVVVPDETEAEAA
jgi:hypothetical protein